MSVHFASANHPARRLGWRASERGLVTVVRARAANDNGDSPLQSGIGAFDPLLADALRHFAVRGLAAAETAADLAAKAALRDDADAKDHWLAVTRMFDRRLAAHAGRTLVTA